MTLITLILIIVFSVSVMVYVFSQILKNKKSTDTMIFGIAVLIFGGILRLDADIDLLGVEYIFILLGLYISTYGLFKKHP